MSTNEFDNKHTKVEANKVGDVFMIDVDDLVPSPQNAYEMSEIDKLASYMVANNFYVTTLEVERLEGQDGKYEIISGHRRCEAWKKLLESGVTTERRLPCVIRHFAEESFSYKDEKSGEGKRQTISAETQKTVALILSNLGQRQDKSLKVEVWEIEQLEPYARMKYLQREEGARGKFKDFFAKEILEISPAELQRKKRLLNLTEKAQHALYTEGIISKQAAVALASLLPEFQDHFIDEVHDKTKKGLLEEVKVYGAEPDPEKMEAVDDYAPVSSTMPQNKKNDEGDDDDEPGGSTDTEDETEDEPGKEPQEFTPSNDFQGYAEDEEDPGKRTRAKKDPDVIIPLPKWGTYNPQEEATSWIRQTIEQVRDMADAEQKKSQAVGNDHDAAQWGMRKEAANLQLSLVE